MERGDAIERVVTNALTTCSASVIERFQAPPITFDRLVGDATERAARVQGLRALRLPSGAFHDAQFMARICPSGMIFVPSRGGVSHHPSEYTSPAPVSSPARESCRASIGTYGAPVSRAARTAMATSATSTGLVVFTSITGPDPNGSWNSASAFAEIVRTTWTR